jgi:LacI family transcriptional regulator
LSSRITMSDVARQAGVSLMTVSRVINHKDDVSSDTRQRVLQIIKELDYRPSAIARSLATQETRTIGLVIPDVTNPFFADITRGVEQLAYAQGYHVFLCNAEEDPKRELGVIQSLEDKRVDGLILCSSRLDEERLTSLLARLPAAVLINRHLDGIPDEFIVDVSLDDEFGGKIVTQHLLDRGHRQIGILSGPITSYSGQERVKGYHTAMLGIGVEPITSWVANCLPSVEGGIQATHALLNKHPELTALFCYNDLVAVGALQACIQINRRVPDDLAVVGYDDIPMAAMVTPALTTCRVERHQLGVKAVTALIDRIKGCQNGCDQIILQPELIIRQSAP